MPKILAFLFILGPVLAIAQIEPQKSKWVFGVNVTPGYELNDGFGKVTNGYGLDAGIYVSSNPAKDFHFSFAMNLNYLQMDFRLNNDEIYKIPPSEFVQLLTTGHLDYQSFSITTPISLEYRPSRIKSFLIFFGVSPVFNLSDQTLWTYSEKKVERQTGRVLNEIEERQIPFTQKLFSTEWINVGVGWYSGKLSVVPVLSSGTVRFFEDYPDLHIIHRLTAKLRVRYEL